MSMFKPTEVIILHPNDTLLVHITNETTRKMAGEIYSSLKELFPNNQVSLINNMFIEGFTVFTDKIDTNPFLIEAEDLC